MESAKEKKEPRFRRMFLTLENYQNHGLDHGAIVERIKSFKSLEYGCFDLEISANGVPHAHVYLVFENQVRVSTIKNTFGAFTHIDKAQGSHEQCIAYCEKSGEKNASKKETQVDNSFWEYGERPQSKEEKNRSIWAGVYELAKTGEYTALEILEVYPTIANHLAKIELLVERCKTEKSKNQWRDVSVFIYHGDTATGKTTYVYEHFKDKKIFRVTDYEHPYEGYSGEEVMCYDEFDSSASSMRLSAILQLCDRFPLGAALTRRFNNLVPQFTTVIFISNEPPSSFYKTATPKQWNAFLRRVTKIYRFDALGLMTEENKAQYLR